MEILQHNYLICLEDKTNKISNSLVQTLHLKSISNYLWRAMTLPPLAITGGAFSQMRCRSAREMFRTQFNRLQNLFCVTAMGTAKIARMWSKFPPEESLAGGCRWMAGSKSIWGMNERDHEVRLQVTRWNERKMPEKMAGLPAGAALDEVEGISAAAASPWQRQRTQPALEPSLGLRCAMNEWRHWGGAQGIRWRNRSMRCRRDRWAHMRHQSAFSQLVLVGVCVKYLSNPYEYTRKIHRGCNYPWFPCAENVLQCCLELKRIILLRVGNYKIGCYIHLPLENFGMHSF